MLGAAIAALLLLAAAPAEGAAQARAGVAPPPPLVLEVRAGFSSPKGDLGDLADDGQYGAVGLGWRVLPRVALVAEGWIENLERGGDPDFIGGVLGPDVELWRYLLMAHVELTDPVLSRWEVAVQAGGGGTHVRSSGSQTTAEFSAHEPTLAMGLSAGYDLTDHLTLFARGGGSIWFDGVNQFAGDPFGKEVSLYQTGGVRVSF